MSYVIRKPGIPERLAPESTSAEVQRIWTRWTRGNVSACRYCGAPMILHSQSECERTQARIEEEHECLSS